MFGRNLILLRWNLRRANVIPARRRHSPDPTSNCSACSDLATAPETRAEAHTRLPSKDAGERRN
jgi:hypothetical protein